MLYSREILINISRNIFIELNYITKMVYCSICPAHNLFCFSAFTLKLTSPPACHAAYRKLLSVWSGGVLIAVTQEDETTKLTVLCQVKTKPGKHGDV